MKRFTGMIITITLCFSMAVASFAFSNCKVSNATESSKGKTLVVYFSFSHGNTKSIAERLQKALDADIVKLEPITSYPHDNDKMDKQGREEVNSQFKPKLKALGVDLKSYDRIIIGTPTWWYKMAPVVLSFMSSNDFNDKTVVPFSTNAGWAGSVIKDMTELAQQKGAKVVSGHAFLFPDNNSGQPSVSSPEELEQWLESLK